LSPSEDQSMLSSQCPSYSILSTRRTLQCTVTLFQSVAFLAVYEVKCRPVRFTGSSRGYLRQNPDSSALQLRCLGANDDLPFPQLLLLPLVSQTLLGHSVGGNVSNGGNVTSAGWQVTLGHRDKLNLVVWPSPASNSYEQTAWVTMVITYNAQYSTLQRKTKNRLTT